MSALFSRFVLAGVFLALVAAVVTTTGAGVFGGSLGSLFGYHEHLAASPAPVILAGDLPTVLAARVRTPAHEAPGAALRRRLNRHRPHSLPERRPAMTPSPVSPSPVVPSPAPAPPPAPKPTPPPSQGNVAHVEDTVRQVTAPVAPVQQPVEQALQTVNHACTAIGGCP